MGYRHYFYTAKKSDIDAIQNLNLSEIFEYARNRSVDINEDENYFSFRDNKFLYQTEVFEFGKLYYDDTAERVYKTGKPLFTNSEVQNYFVDYNPYIVGKEGLLEAIKIYEDKIKSYFKDLVAGELGDPAQEALLYVQRKTNWFEYLPFVNIDEDNYKITTSWEYEYSIFNLAHVLKSINWETDTLLFYGW